MRKRLRFVLVLLCLFLLLSVTVPSTASDTSLLRIHFLDVGQGDAVLLRTSDGDILIDAGTEASEELLCRRLDALGVHKLKLAIFTHFDEDHIGGADGVIRHFGAEKIWLGMGIADNEASIRLLQAAEEAKAEVRRVLLGEMFSLGELFLYVLYPASRESVGGNEESLIVRLQYGDVDALFMGDAGIEQEMFLIEYYGKAHLSVELCKIGHHGSNTSTSNAFIDCVCPQYAVISCGAGNSYGHPMGGVLATLNEYGVDVYRTDLQGEIVFESNGESIDPVFDG